MHQTNFFLKRISTKTKIGTLHLFASDRGLHAICVASRIDEVKKRLTQRTNGFKATAIAKGHLRKAKENLDKYFSGDTKALEKIKVFTLGTEFQTKVWSQLRAVPVGKTVTYSQVAKKIGKPKAYRAVAMACRDNLICLSIPCHRVVRGDGSLGGYNAGGVSKKKLLLKHEGV